jgi:hypothetical protein
MPGCGRNSGEQRHSAKNKVSSHVGLPTKRYAAKTPLANRSTTVLKPLKGKELVTAGAVTRRLWGGSTSVGAKSVVA